MNLSQILLLLACVSLVKVSGFNLFHLQREESKNGANYDSLIHLQRKEQDIDQVTFSQTLFNNPFSVEVRQAVLETQFFQKMINNTLAPEEYGGYMVQDAAYVYDAIKAFDLAAEKMQGQSPPDFALFYRDRSASYASYSSYFDSSWKLQNSESVKMGPAAATYVAYQMKLAETNATNLVIGFLPCDMLWPWVATEIDPLVPKTNVYRSWVDDNLPDGTSSTQAFVNNFFHEQDLATSQPIFNEGMINELNFFRSACDEEPMDYDLSGTI